jgi:hypothetical protein
MKKPGESRHDFFVRRCGELGVGQSDADYGGKLGDWVLELSRVMRDQGHSGQSFVLTLALFDNLVQEWQTPESVPEQPLSPAANFDAQAQALAYAAANVDKAVRLADGVWPNTMEAAAWASEFVKRFGDVDRRIDEGLMVAWFANAIMSGHDRGYRKGQADLKNVTVGFDPGHEEPTQSVVPRAKMFLSKEDPRLIQRAVCSKCGAGIYWLTSAKTGKKMPFDSLVQMVDDDGHLGVDLAKNHWSTCPNAADFRKKG